MLDNSDGMRAKLVDTELSVSKEYGSKLGGGAQALPLSFTSETKDSVTVTWSNLDVSLGGKKILTDISGYLQPGEMVGILGATGSGKTTLLNCLAGRLHPSAWSGSVKVNGVSFEPTTWGNRRSFVEVT